ncbi:BTB/POZ domain-containing protein 3 [Temnothorax longispinosus]|uniref:BTB/POZ domain-containing protein 3 n=1 Tax=Temnothorax longispinosus TaxID=300112 RepID=A0A4S2KYP3_9HYME|nr:BTB/POZ domain-containing protein 3 [Temnothorax longispinosus]
MAMSNLYSKISTKPMKRFQDNVAVKQTNAWMNAESPSNTSDSPPSVSPLSSSIVLQREGITVNQPLSAPASPLSSLSSPVTHVNLLSPGDCTQDPNWQATKPTVRERNAAMFNNHLMADIIFIVGSPGHTQTIPAHKYVLATGSSVFYAMFYGGLPENKRDIEVPDVEPAAFLALLRYMYCDEVQLEADTVLATLYVAKKYIVPHLARACVNYLETSLTAKNACLLLSQSRLFEEPNLMQRCWEVIDAQVSQMQRTLRTITLSDKNLDRTLEDYSSRPSSDSVTHISSLRSCVYDTNVDTLRYRRAACKSNGGVNDDTCESFKSGLSIVPHCLSLSENDCCTNAEMALRSDGFVDIDIHTLESVLSRETLNCKEIHIWDAALRWASAECIRQDLEPIPANQRQLLGSALYLIRLPAMNLEEFANSAAQTGILTHQETIDLFLHFTASNKPQLCFPTKPRQGLKTQVCHRFQSCAYRSNQWRYRGRCDSIQFSVDKRIFVVGFGLYGSSSGAADYNVKIELKRLGNVLAENNTKFFSDGSSNTFHVYFENPIQIEPECSYTASAILDGGELSFFGQEGMSEATVGSVNFQFQCSSESTNGTGVQGGQIPELIFYGPPSDD